MEPISAGELTDLRTEAASIFDLTATVIRVATNTQDSVGGRTKTTSTFTVACRLLHNDRRAERLKEIPTDRAAVHAKWQMLIPVGTNLRLTDQVTIGALTFTVIRANHERSTPIFESVSLNLIE